MAKKRKGMVGNKRGMLYLLLSLLVLLAAAYWVIKNNNTFASVDRAPRGKTDQATIKSQPTRIISMIDGKTGSSKIKPFMESGYLHYSIKVKIAPKSNKGDQTYVVNKPKGVSVNVSDLSDTSYSVNGHPERFEEHGANETKFTTKITGSEITLTVFRARSDNRTKGPLTIYNQAESAVKSTVNLDFTL